MPQQLCRLWRRDCMAGNRIAYRAAHTFCTTCHLMHPHCTTCGKGGRDDTYLRVHEGSPALRARGITSWECSDEWRLLLCSEGIVAYEECHAHTNTVTGPPNVLQQGPHPQVAAALTLHIEPLPIVPGPLQGVAVADLDLHPADDNDAHTRGLHCLTGRPWIWTPTRVRAHAMHPLEPFAAIECRLN